MNVPLETVSSLDCVLSKSSFAGRDFFVNNISRLLVRVLNPSSSCGYV